MLVQHAARSIAQGGRLGRHRSVPGAGAWPDSPGKLTVSGDEAALRQVLVNLLTNAAKYGLGAPVRIGADASVDTVRVRVEDHGPGLPESDLEPIFDLFYRSDTNARRASGTGIGLYVVRRLVIAMGGTVRAFRVEPTGLGFIVELRAEPATDHDLAPSEIARWARPRPAAATAAAD